MKNIVKLSTIAMLALIANTSQATQLVKVQPINAVEFIESTKLHLAQSIKLNTITFNPIEKTARAQVAMNQAQTEPRVENISKRITLAE